MNNSHESPLVSIIVRTKDRPKLLKRALGSIFVQTYRPIEVVLVNDGGCDLDIDEIKSILGDVSLNYIRLEQNTGRAHAGNVGIENAKGEYIGFLDDDDEFLPEHIEVLVSFLTKSDYKVAYTDAMMLYEEDALLKTVSDDNYKNLVFSNDFDYSLLLFENYIPFMCPLFKRDAIMEAGGLDPSFTLYEDWDLLIRIAEKHPFHHIKGVTAYYKQWNPGLQISQQNQDHFFLKASYINIISKHIGKLTPEGIHSYMIRHASLRAELRAHDVASILAKLKEKNEKRTYLEIELSEKNERLTAMSCELKEKDDKLFKLQKSLDQRDALISAMIDTRGWRLLESYRRLRNKIFKVVPPDAKENVFIKGIKVLKHQGLQALIQKANKKFLFNRSIKASPSLISIDSSIISKVGNMDIIEPIKSKVSIIIPTKNAGDEFDYTLRRITQQEGIREIEFVIIDSGSDDKTLEIAKKYSSTIFQISPDAFHHARTRNYGAEKATGEYLVFTVQDAIPIGNYWLYKLLMPIYSGSASAASAIQIPRSDADLFACWSYWAHYVKFLRREKDSIYNRASFDNFDRLSEGDKRIAVSLDNVSLGIKKEIFNLYQFHADYAEDLELGVRLIKDGHSLIFQSSNAVIHSHNRPPVYYLKRSYSDRISVCKILNIKRNRISTKALIESMSYTYRLLKRCLQSLKIKGDKPWVTVETLISDIYSQSKKYNSFSSPLTGDSHLDAFFRYESPIKHDAITLEIIDIFCDNLKSFREYLTMFDSFQWHDKELIESIYKIFSNVAGTCIAANTQDEIAALKGGI